MPDKILVVEDDENIVQTISLIFKHYSPDTEIIFSYLGRPAVKMIEVQEPDAIILDLGLPDIEGIELLKIIRLFSSIPIIVLTGQDAEDIICKALEEDATDYLIKPFKHRELIARVQSHVTRWKTNEIRALISSASTSQKNEF
jgi:two-component system, OmpR family, KDP operon response regulator KdpE